MAEKDEEELQKTLMQLESGRRQLDSIAKQAQMVESALLEVNATIQALNALAEVKDGTEILVNLGANTFAKASLKEKDKILIGVGACMSVEKSRADAVKSLEGRRDELAKSLVSLQKMSNDVGAKVAQLNDAAESMIGHRH